MCEKLFRRRIPFAVKAVFLSGWNTLTWLSRYLRLTWHHWLTHPSVLSGLHLFCVRHFVGSALLAHSHHRSKTWEQTFQISFLWQELRLWRSRVVYRTAIKTNFKNLIMAFSSLFYSINYTHVIVYQTIVIYVLLDTTLIIKCHSPECLRSIWLVPSLPPPKFRQLLKFQDIGRFYRRL